MVAPSISPPPVPALVVGKVNHARWVTRPRSFTYRQYQWLVDLDHLPRLRWPLRWLARFDVRDHFDRGRLGGGIRGDIERFLAHRGVMLEPDDRVLMLANARVFGYVFDPMSAFWCLGPDGEVRAAVIEVHNTYGERHAYLIHPDAKGQATVEKSFYVSPFNDSTGTYTMRLRMKPNIVSVTIRLDKEGTRVFDASVAGTPRPATTSAVLSTFARFAFMPQRATFLIRVHGIWLWLRRLPVFPRPQHSPEAVR